MTTPTPEIPSGLTVDGTPVPQAIESEGGAAIAAFLADTPTAAPAVDTAPNPPTHAEGAET